MSDVTKLLPSASLDFVRAAAAGMSDHLDVPYAILMNPYQTPADSLPWLAAHSSLDLWFDDWTEDRKREAVAQASGRSIIHDGEIAALKGTRSGTIRYLALVDAQLLDVIAYPARFVFGRAVLGRTPIGHPPFLARHLVKTLTYKPRRALVLGRSTLGARPIPPLIFGDADISVGGSLPAPVLRIPDRTPLDRARKAMATAKAPETEYRADFAHRRHIRIDDGLPLDGSHALGGYLDRTRL